MHQQKCPGGPIYEKIREVLGAEAEEISIFHLMDRDEIECAAEYFELRHVPSGTVLVREGEKIDSIGIITEGMLEARHKPTIGDREITIAHLEDGAHIGSVSFPGGRSAMATLVAEEETDLLVLTQERFEAFAEKYPAAAVSLLKGIIEVLTVRLESAIDRVILFF